MLWESLNVVSAFGQVSSSSPQFQLKFQQSAKQSRVYRFRSRIEKLFQSGASSCFEVCLEAIAQRIDLFGNGQLVRRRNRHEFGPAS